MAADDAKEDREPHWHRFEPPLVLEGGDLNDFVGRVLPGARAVAVDYLDRGVVNSNYQVEVVRAGPPPGRETMHLRLSRSDLGALREGAVTRGVADVLSISVPRLLGTERGDRPETHRRSLFTWVPGDSLELRMPEALLIDLAPSLGAELARLHQTRFESFGRFDANLVVLSPRGQPPAMRAADDLARRISVRLENPAHGLDREAQERVRVGVARGLARLWTAPIPAALVHGDLSPGNMIVTRDGAGRPVLSGLIDWEMARAADPAHDLASLRFEFGATHPSFARSVEAAYLDEPQTGAWTGPRLLWDLRVRLASVPMLLDARMVAERRRAAAALERIDQLLSEALPVS